MLGDYEDLLSQLLHALGLGEISSLTDANLSGTLDALDVAQCECDPSVAGLDLDPRSAEDGADPFFIQQQQGVSSEQIAATATNSPMVNPFAQQVGPQAPPEVETWADQYVRSHLRNTMQDVNATNLNTTRIWTK